MSLCHPDLENIDRILDALEAAGCCRNNYVNAPEDVVANAIREFLRARCSCGKTADSAAESAQPIDK